MSGASIPDSSPPPPIETAAVGRVQTRLTLLMAAVLVLSTAGVAALSRWSRPLRWMFQRQMEIWRTTDVPYAYDVGYIDSDDRLLLQEVWDVDYRRGGVFFIGSSTTQYSIAPWLLPEAERPLVHNFAVKSANYAEQYRFVRYLTEQRGLLSAGPGRTMVVLGLAHFDTRPKLTGATDWNYIPALFERHGLYQYDPANGLIDKPISPVWRTITRERMRAYDFLQSLGSHTDFRGKPFQNVPTRTAQLDAIARKFVHIMMGGDDWRRHMTDQLHQLDEMVGYLQSHGAAVGGILLPLESWNHGLPEAEEYRQRVIAIAAAHRMPLADRMWSLPDSDFADSTHLNFLGQQAITEVMGALAREHLARTGELPLASSPAVSPAPPAP
jgi:hypothetical protein